MILLLVFKVLRKNIVNIILNIQSGIDKVPFIPALLQHLRNGVKIKYQSYLIPFH